MSLLNGKTFLLLLAAALATWQFPFGIMIDAGIAVAYVLAKRKRVPGAAPARKAAPAQAAPADDPVKLLAMAMLSDRVDASGTAAAASLDLSPAPAPRKPATRATPIAPADRAAKLRSLE